MQHSCGGWYPGGGLLCGWGPLLRPAAAHRYGRTRHLQVVAQHLAVTLLGAFDGLPIQGPLRGESQPDEGFDNSGVRG